MTQWLTAFMLVSSAAAASAAPPNLTEMPRLDSTTVARRHPFVFFSPEEIATARRQSETPAMKPVFERLKASAATAMRADLPPLPNDWWPAIKDKDWLQTYPDIFLHTQKEPAAIAAHLRPLVPYWLITRDDKALAKTKQILLHLAPFSFEPEHFDVGMNYSTWAYSVLRAYDAVYDELTPAQRATLDDFCTRLGAAVLKNDIYWIDNGIGGGINNHLAWHKLTIGLLGLLYDREPLVEYALHGRRGMVELLDVGVIDDGLWCESSLTYQFAAIVPMALFEDCIERTGRPERFDARTLADGRSLAQTFSAMIETLFPDAVIPPIGDAYGARTPLWRVPTYETAWRLWQDPRFAWLLAQSPERPTEALFTPPLPESPPAPPIATRLFPEHGYAFLRTRRDAEYWSDDAACAMLTFDRFNVHSNADKLSLMYFACGKLLLPDVEGKATVPHAFSSKIQRELNRGGLSQNTVMIDGRDQTGTNQLLDLVEFRDLPAEKRVTAADRRGLLYAGVRQQRTLALTDDYLLDVFQVVADTPRQIDWIMHALDTKAERASGPDASPIDPPASDGAWAWLRRFRASTNDADWHITWRSDDVRLRIDMLAAADTQIVQCDYPADDKPDSAGIPMLIVRRNGNAATFVTVYTAGRADLPGVRITPGPKREDRLTYLVECKGVTRLHTVPRLTPRQGLKQSTPSGRWL